MWVQVYVLEASAEASSFLCTQVLGQRQASFGDLLPVEPREKNGTGNHNIVRTTCLLALCLSSPGARLLSPFESPTVMTSFGMLMRRLVAEGSCIASIKGLVVRAANPVWRSGTLIFASSPSQGQWGQEIPAVLVCFCCCDGKQLREKGFTWTSAPGYSPSFQGAQAASHVHLQSRALTCIYSQKRRETNTPMLTACR